MLCWVAIEMDVRAKSKALSQTAWVVHGSDGAEYVEKDPITTPEIRAAYIGGPVVNVEKTLLLLLLLLPL